jgi:hypothetical protein
VHPQSEKSCRHVNTCRVLTVKAAKDSEDLLLVQSIYLCTSTFHEQGAGWCYITETTGTDRQIIHVFENNTSDTIVNWYRETNHTSVLRLRFQRQLASHYSLQTFNLESSASPTEGMKSKGHNQGSHLEPELWTISAFFNPEQSMESVNLSPNSGVCDEFPGGKMEWLVGNRVPEKQQRNRRLWMKASQTVAFSNKVIMPTHIIQFQMNSTVRSEPSSECNIARCLAFTFSAQPISEFAKHVLMWKENKG